MVRPCVGSRIVSLSSLRGRSPMNRRRFAHAAAIAALGTPLLAGSVFGQQKSLTEHLLGTWMLVSHESVRADGSRVPVYGLNPKGIAFFDRTGHFIITVM